MHECARGYVRGYMCGCVCACVHACACKPEDDFPQLFLYLIVWRQGLLPSWKCAMSARLAGHWTPGAPLIPLWFLSQSIGHLGMDFNVPNRCFVGIFKNKCVFWETVLGLQKNGTDKTEKSHKPCTPFPIISILYQFDVLVTTDKPILALIKVQASC